MGMLLDGNQFSEEVLKTIEDAALERKITTSCGVAIEDTAPEEEITTSCANSIEDATPGMEIATTCNVVIEDAALEREIKTSSDNVPGELPETFAAERDRGYLALV